MKCLGELIAGEMGEFTKSGKSQMKTSLGLFPLRKVTNLVSKHIKVAPYIFNSLEPLSVNRVIESLYIT